MWTLLQTQDQNEKMYNALGRGGGSRNVLLLGSIIQTSRSELLVITDLLLANTYYCIS